MSRSTFAASSYRGPCPRAAVAVAASLLATLIVPTGASAMEFDAGNPDLAIRWDNTVRLNYGVRVEQRDDKIGNSAVADEGTYSFDRGDAIAKRFDLLSELDVVWRKQHGLRVSAAAWGDAAYERQEPQQSEPAAGQHPELRRQQLQRLHEALLPRPVGRDPRRVRVRRRSISATCR